ncbi:MAG: STAS domain-containing protein, partial [Gemmatimonadetes bacterium]|nr:STAS domain-containing protein [Gemmatimonadota bacterium]
MEISVDRANEVLIAKVEGRIDGANAREFEDALNGAIGEDDSKVLLDFSALSYIS